MDKHFPVEPFDYGYEGEDEDEWVRDHRRGHTGYVWRSPGGGNVAARVRQRLGSPGWQRPGSAWSQRSPWQQTGSHWWQKRGGSPYGGNPAAYAQWQRRHPGVRYPYLPFPSAFPSGVPSPFASPFSSGLAPDAGCSCDQPLSTSEPQPPEPQAAMPAVGDAAPPASPGAGGAGDQELYPWDPSATGFRARRRRRVAERGLPVPLQLAFDRPTRHLHLEAEDPEDADPSAGAAPRLGTLSVAATGRHRFSYAFTQDDLLWTARFLVGEAGGEDNLDNAAVIWAMFNRYALFTHSHYSSFHKFLRAYSTPLQRVLHSAGAARRHMNDPSFVKTGDSYPGTDIPRGQLRRFLALQERPWDKLPRGARALALRALQGGVADPIGNATEFASTAVYFRDRYGKRARLDDATWRQFTERYAASKQWAWVGDVPGLNQRNNAFFVDQRVAGLPAGAVRVTA